MSLLDDTKKEMPAFSLGSLAGVYLRICNTTFGGGDPTILALRKELQEQRQLLSPEQFGLAYLLARVTPGTNMIAFCAGTGYQIRGWPGAILAVAGAALPPTIAGVLIMRFFDVWMQRPAGVAALRGLTAAAIGLMFAGALMLAVPQFSRRAWFRPAVLLAGSLILSLGVQLSPLQVMAAAGVAGALWKDGGEK